jgi:ribosome maturation factor RimP
MPSTQPREPRRAGPADRRALSEVIEPVVAKAGYDVEGLTVSSAGRRSLVRVVVDSDAGVGLDDIATLSHDISAALDDRDGDGLGGIMGGAPYVLEVTSPGVDRPLSQPRHWRRSVGRLVKVDLDGGPSQQGRVVSADDSGADLDADGERVRIDYAAVRSARVQVEFKHPKEAGREH